MKNMFSIKARLASFKNAWRGVTVFVRQEHNAWIHCAMTVLVIIAGLLFHISTVEWDVVQPEKDDRIRDVKDICAGAVLICAITAAIIGSIIFLPKLLMLF